MQRGRVRSFGSLMLCALVMGMSACGGGGGAGTPAVSPPPVKLTTVSAATTTITFTADVSEATPAPAVVLVTVANPPAATLFAKLTSSGNAVASMSFAWQSPASGQLTVSLPNPAALGPGSFSGSVTLTVCTDSGCGTTIAGSPVIVAVNYTVTAQSTVPSTFRLQQVASGFVAHTTDTSPPVAGFDVFLSDVPAAGLYIKLNQPSGGFITAVSNTQSTDSGGTVTVAVSLTLVPPASLGSGFFGSSVTFAVCYDKACQHQLAGSPATEPISYDVYLTEGHEYIQKSLSIGGVSDVAYDPAGKQLYVSALSGYLSNYSGAITPIDPLTGNSGTPAALGDSPFGVAVSDDGGYLYVGSVDNPVVHRLTLPALSADLDIPLGSSGDPNTGGGPNTVHELAVAPGAPHTLAVSMGHKTGRQTGGTVIFDDAVARPQGLAPLGFYAEPDDIAWGATAGSLYALRYSSSLPLEVDVDTVSVDGGGMTVANKASLDPATYAFGRTFYAAGRAYDSLGHVVDAASGVALGHFDLPGTQTYIVSLLPDPANGRVFVLVPHGTGSQIVLLIYSDATFALQSVVDLGLDMPDNALTTHMISWGSDGLAFNRNGVQILAGSFLAAVSSAATAHHTARAQTVPLPAGGFFVRQPRR